MIKLNKKLLATSIALASFAVIAADEATPTNMNGMQMGNTETGSSMNGMSDMSSSKHCALKLGADQFVLGTLPQTAIDDLLFMREEEKLARDVYKALYNKWFVGIFFNISDSEQMHMDRIKIFLDAYNLEDSIAAEEGKFNNPKLQALYDELIIRGSVSELEAHKVGALVEELDIKDLLASIENTDVPELKKMYGNLLHASHMHLRKFTNPIIASEGSYTAQALSQEEVDAILNDTSTMMMGMGNGQRITLDGEQKTKACFVSSFSADEKIQRNGSAVTSNQAINIAYNVNVDTSDVGKTAEWVMVANYKQEGADEARWLVSNEGQWQEWDGNMDNLTAAQSGAVLTAEQSVPIFEGNLNGATGDYKIYMGYRTEDTGLVYNPAPLMFSVQP